MGLLDSVRAFLDDYDPYRDRPSVFTHRCQLPRVGELRDHWKCPRCGCPWVVRWGMKQWTSVRQADSRAPHETTLVGETKTANTRPRWYFDHDSYRGTSSGQVTQ